MRHKFRYFARETVISLRRNLLMTIAGILTVAVSLLLVGGSLMLRSWVDNGTQKWRDGVEFEVFMDPAAPQDQIDVVDAELAADPAIENYVFYSHEDAYEEFKRLFSDQQSLIENTRPEDLPTSFRVTPTEVELTDGLVDKYENEFPGVDDVQTPDESIATLLTITRVLRYMFIALAIVLLSSALFLIMNTIRLATFARRREIEVMKLVGASNWFVRIPFMAEGFVQGALGAGLAIGGVFGLWYIFDRYQSGSGGFFAGYYVDIETAYWIALAVLAFGILIGVVGSIFGVRRFLKA
jgi:cell division transport system permease protein